jgi:hypothetical protein
VLSFRNAETEPETVNRKGLRVTNPKKLHQPLTGGRGFERAVLSFRNT